MAKDSSIMGIEFFGTGLSSLLKEMEKGVFKKGAIFTTPNPEILLTSVRNMNLRKVLLTSTHNFPDGVGIKVLQVILRKKVTKRVTGGALFASLIALSEKMKWKVFVLGGSKDSHIGSLAKIRANHPELNIIGEWDVAVNTMGEVTEKENVLLEKMKKINPKLIFLALGCPKQELWISNYRKHFPESIFVTIGGVLDVYSGRLPKPPALIRTIGMEWLWRVMIQPKRWMRIVRAVFVFPFVAIAWEVRKNYSSRSTI